LTGVILTDIIAFKYNKDHQEWQRDWPCEARQPLYF